MPWKRNPTTGQMDPYENNWADFLPFLMKQGQQQNKSPLNFTGYFKAGDPNAPLYPIPQQRQADSYGAGEDQYGGAVQPYPRPGYSGQPTTTQRPSSRDMLSGANNPTGGSTTARPTSSFNPVIAEGMGAGWSGGAATQSKSAYVQHLEKLRELILKSITDDDTSSGGSGSSDGWSPNAWERAFMGEHEGRTPREEYYYSPFVQGNRLNPDWARFYSPEDEADWDRQWGEQFQRTYGRGPDEDDWKASYEHRNAMKYGGAKPFGG